MATSTEDLPQVTDVANQLLEASEKGDLDTVRNLVEASGPGLVNSARDSDGYGPLHRSVYNAHIEVSCYLLEQGRANPNARTHEHWTPLHSACHWNVPAAASLLLRSGARADALTRGGQTPLHLAATQRENLAVLRLLLLNPFVRPGVRNEAGDTAADIALRSGGNAHLICEIQAPEVNEI